MSEETEKPRTSCRGAVTKSVLKCTAAQHGATINELAARGLIAPVSFTAPDGVRRIANSMWAAHDWIKATGYYERPGSAPIVYHLGGAK